MPSTLALPGSNRTTEGWAAEAANEKTSAARGMNSLYMSMSLWCFTQRLQDDQPLNDPGSAPDDGDFSQ
jgi:hypothetical protein